MIRAASLKAVWNFRGFVLGSVRRDYQLRYRGTVLGIVWILLQPLAMIFVYTIVFSQVMKPKFDGLEGEFAYSIYLCTGIIVWNLFAEIIQRTQSVFLDNANLLKKISFPRLTLPVIVVVTALLNFVIVFGVFLLFLILTGNQPDSAFFSMIPLLVVLVSFAAALGVTIGVFNVFLRDAGQISGLLLQLWFWATPIVYPVSILPDWLRPWMNLNPMYHLIQGCQNILVFHRLPVWQDLFLLALLSAGLSIYALRFFRRHVDELVDEL